MKVPVRVHYVIVVVALLCRSREGGPSEAGDDGVEARRVVVVIR